MSWFFDWVLIVISTLILFFSYKRIVFMKNCSIANYVIVLLVVFCVLPILFNYLVGIPSYEVAYWYKPFIKAMENEGVNIAYDIYVLTCIITLYFLCAKKKPKKELNEFNTLSSFIADNKILRVILIALPIIYIVVTGAWKNYAVYAVSSARGLTESNSMLLMTPFMLISMITVYSIAFKGDINIRKMIGVVIYSIAIVWISGKRFMLANLLLLMIFYLVNLHLSTKNRKRIFRILPIAGVLLVAFSIFYLSVVRPMAETTVESLYDMLRVDFGRDDVIKYVIYTEFVEKDHILDYYGQSFLGLIGAFIPRMFWATKPYPHYMYLTGSILNLDIHNLPAGTTPSLLEMTICNFGYWGFIVGILLLIWICRWADKMNDIDNKAIALILISVLLTQSMDVYLILVVVLAFSKLLIAIFKGRKIRLAFHSKIYD